MANLDTIPVLSGEITTTAEFLKHVARHYAHDGLEGHPKPLVCETSSKYLEQHMQEYTRLLGLTEEEFYDEQKAAYEDYVIQKNMRDNKHPTNQETT